jgi:hypothetical protein
MPMTAGSCIWLHTIIMSVWATRRTNPPAGKECRLFRVEIGAPLTAHEHSNAVLEQIVGRLSLDPTVSAASWSAEWIAQ